MKFTNVLLFLLSTALTSSLLADEQPFEATAGPYTVYYSLFPSTFLRAEVAQAYGMVRAKNRAVLNVSVRERIDEGAQAPTREKSAVVRGTSNDLIHKTPLQFTEVREQGALYYLAEVRFGGTSPRLYFDLQIEPDPGAPPIAISFSKQMSAE